MKVVDAQIHLWSQNLPTNAAHRQIPSWSAEDCLKEMAEAGVDAALIHPPGWDPDSGAVAEAAAREASLPLAFDTHRAAIHLWP